MKFDVGRGSLMSSLDIIFTCLLLAGQRARCETADLKLKEQSLFEMFYWDTPPFIKTDAKSPRGVKGIIPDIIDDIQSLCIDPSSAGNTSYVNYTRMHSEGEMIQEMKRQPRELLKIMLWGPILSRSINSENITRFLAENKIIPQELVRMEKMAVIVRQENLYLLNKILVGLWNCRGVYALFLLTCVIAGLIFWLIDTSQKQDVPFFKGIFTSIWWAFVTMTTVGYGDVVPSTRFGRLFAIMWMYYALIVFCIITGVVTTFVFNDTLFDIYQKKVAVLRNSYEGQMGKKTFDTKNIEFDLYDEILSAVKNDGNIFAGLMLAEVAAWRQDEIHNQGLRVIGTHPLSMHVFLLEGNTQSVNHNATQVDKLRTQCRKYTYEYIYKLNVQGKYKRKLHTTLYIVHEFKSLFGQRYLHIIIGIVVAAFLVGALYSYARDRFGKKNVYAVRHQEPYQ